MGGGAPAPLATSVAALGGLGRLFARDQGGPSLRSGRRHFPMAFCGKNPLWEETLAKEVPGKRPPRRSSEVPRLGPHGGPWGAGARQKAFDWVRGRPLHPLERTPPGKS